MATRCKYYAFSDDPHAFSVGEKVVVMFGLGEDADMASGKVVNVTKRKVSVRFDDGEFRHYSTRNNNREFGSGRSLLTLQYTSHIIGNLREENSHRTLTQL